MAQVPATIYRDIDVSVPVECEPVGLQLECDAHEPVGLQLRGGLTADTGAKENAKGRRREGSRAGTACWRAAMLGVCVRRRRAKPLG